MKNDRLDSRITEFTLEVVRSHPTVLPRRPTKDGETLMTLAITQLPLEAAPPIADAPISSGTLECCPADPTTETEWQALTLTEGNGVVVGRSEGKVPEYLDSRYQPTRQVPGTQQRVVTNPHEGKDAFVSRGHFMLKGSPFGLVLVNGVPRVGGGIRPPLNGTWLLEPQRRRLGPGEEWLIEHGGAIKIWLPNEVTVVVHAD
jgi:hypothetical protein